MKNSFVRHALASCYSFFYFIRQIIVLALVIAVMACSPSSKHGPIRLGVNVWPGYEYLFLARELGYYSEEGLDLHLVETGSLNDLRRAFERGKIDGMASSVIEVVQAAANTGKIAQIFMIPDFSNGADVIIARSPIQSPADLKGKRVGLEVASLGQFVVNRALQKHGLTPDDITIVPMSQEEMLRGMGEGQVDAVMTYPPVSIELLKDDDNLRIFTSADIPGEVMDVVSLKPEILQAQPEVASKILRAWQRALEYAKSHPQEAHRIAAEREGISVEEFSEALSGIKLLSIANQKEFFEQSETIENVVKLVRDVALNPQQQANMPNVEAFIFREPVMSFR